MPIIHVSEADAVRDFAGVLAKLDTGAEVVIERNTMPSAVLRTDQEPRRLLSEALRMAEERGSSATLDPSFSDSLQAAIDSHPESLRDPWE